MATISVEVVSPEEVLFSGEAEMVITKTLAGEIAFQAGHQAFLGALADNHTRVHLVDGTVEDIAVHGGFVEVSGNKVTILSDDAVVGSKVDVEAERRRAHEAEERLRHEHDADVAGQLSQAHTRLRAARHL